MPSAWQNLAPATTPLSLARFGMCWYGDASNIVVFGGDRRFPATPPPVASDQTWTYDTDWTHLTPATSPLRRALMSLAWDRTNANVVMRGGYNGFLPAYYDETWTWDGTTWTNAAPATQPNARVLYAICYDQTNAEIVLFGGGFSATVYDETWTWDGTTWTNKSPTNKPSARVDSGMFFDETRGTVILFGGIDSGGQQNDTWEWDGTDWTQLSPATAVGGADGIALVAADWDTSRSVAVTYGGDGNLSSDTWEWDSTDWAVADDCVNPGTLTAYGLAYHPTLGKTVLYGGTLDSNEIHGENTTWAWPYSCPVAGVQVMRWW